ncbi:ssDNA-binding protein [Campylobacter hyointestinalis]|uniref:ssDNA-binding protein n=1 Tax=Campylobacter hyointestinalis TaxID=198 RepID=UPI00072A130B|nr:ssDNA-binding protein [Campylobacter hyointestinalis]PPB51691.1 hypothetical protein CDQ69_08805 [Campylobacter hyointestinalis subsp. hyointestinalis]PPB55994.1 hypothetical protein CDQ67_01785 [Campylobacter hyointestinalis subsp. hyointestinalis]CUU87483.1 Protein of uncharacterised function (DUF2815) [Campylobacter hyointestinalis subsp. hyointestinalis]
MSQKKKPIKINTPIGIAKFPKIQEADTRFDDMGVYSTQLLLPKDDPNTDALIKRLKEVYEEFRKELPAPKNKKEPESFGFVEDLDKDGNETDYIAFKFKAKAHYIDAKGAMNELPAPRVFDAKLNPIPSNIQIWGGSSIRVNFSPIPYFQGKNCGVTLRLNAVQVIELNTSNGDSAESYGFNATDGYSGDEAVDMEENDTSDF